MKHIGSLNLSIGEKKRYNSYNITILAILIVYEFKYKIYTEPTHFNIKLYLEMLENTLLGWDLSRKHLQEEVIARTKLLAPHSNLTNKLILKMHFFQIFVIKFTS